MTAHTATVTPYVMVDDATEYQRFLEEVFGADVHTAVPLPADPQRTMHAEARIGASTVFFADSGAFGERCLESPSEPVHVQLYASVPDADAVHAKAAAAGARSAMDIGDDGSGGRTGGFVDPFGTLWWVTSPA